LSQGVAVRPGTEERFDILRQHVRRLHAFHGAIMGYKIARKHVNWFLEAEAGQDYRALKASFNALPSPDAQEAFLRDHKSFIFKLIRSAESGNTLMEVAA
jgi:tRNA-dihydrouridine synthase B